MFVRRIVTQRKHLEVFPELQHLYNTEQCSRELPCFSIFYRAGGYDKYHHHLYRSKLQYLSSESNY